MSLDELRAKANEEEAAAETEPSTAEEAEEAPEATEEVDDNAEEVESVDDDEFGFEVEGGEPEPQKPTEITPEKALVHKLSKEKKKRQAAQQEAQEKDQRIAELEARLAAVETGGQKAEPVQASNVSKDFDPYPDIYDPEISGDRQKLTQAIVQWQNRQAEKANAQAQQQAQQAEQERLAQERLERFATRMASLTKQGVSGDKIESVVDTVTNEVDTTVGIDGAFTYLMDAVGDGAERVAYYIGTDAGAKAKFKQLLQEDPNGLKAIAWAAEMKVKLKPKQRRVSEAPEPDQPLEGGKQAAPVSSTKLQEAYDKVSSEGDLQKMRDIRKQAKERGVILE